MLSSCEAPGRRYGYERDERNAEGEPELNLLLPKSIRQQPLWESSYENIEDLLFPRRLPLWLRRAQLCTH